MPFTYAIYPEAELAVVRYSGRVTSQVLYDAFGALLSDAAWRPGYDRLWDWSGIEELAVEPEDLRAYKELTVKEAGRVGMGRAAIVTQEGVDELLGAYYRVLAPWQIKSFLREEQALAWLGKRLPADGRHGGESAEGNAT